MFVCLCHGVSDKKIRSLIQSGATTIQQLQAHCSAGSNCGMCLCQLKEMIDETTQEQPTQSSFQKASND